MYFMNVTKCMFLKGGLCYNYNILQTAIFPHMEIVKTNYLLF